MIRALLSQRNRLSYEMPGVKSKIAFEYSERRIGRDYEATFTITNISNVPIKNLTIMFSRSGRTAFENLDSHLLPNKPWSTSYWIMPSVPQEGDYIDISWEDDI